MNKGTLIKIDKFLESKGFILLILVLLLVLLPVTLSLVYSNSKLEEQIYERDNYIRKLQYTDSLARNYLDYVETDTISYFVYHLDKQGHRQTYKDLSKEVERLERELEIKDRIIVLAKHKYNFNYSYKMEGDSLFIYSFWSKDK